LHAVGASLFGGLEAFACGGGDEVVLLYAVAADA
jgi:hypothetical protein